MKYTRRAATARVAKKLPIPAATRFLSVAGAGTKGKAAKTVSLSIVVERLPEAVDMIGKPLVLRSVVPDAVALVVSDVKEVYDPVDVSLSIPDAVVLTVHDPVDVPLSVLDAVALAVSDVEEVYDPADVSYSVPDAVALAMCDPVDVPLSIPDAVALTVHNPVNVPGGGGGAFRPSSMYPYEPAPTKWRSAEYGLPSCQVHMRPATKCIVST